MVELKPRVVSLRRREGEGEVQRADICVVFEQRRSLDDATRVVGVGYTDDVGKASVGTNYLRRCVVDSVESDEHTRDDFAQVSVPRIREGGGVESGVDRALLLGGIGIDGDIDERVSRRFVVFNGPSSFAFSVDAEADLAALS